MRRLLVAILLLIIQVEPAMSFHIVDPWPDPTSVHNVRQERVSFRKQ